MFDRATDGIGYCDPALLEVDAAQSSTMRKGTTGEVMPPALRAALEAAMEYRDPTWFL